MTDFLVTKSVAKWLLFRQIMCLNLRPNGRKFQDFLNVKVFNLQPIFQSQNSSFFIPICDRFFSRKFQVFSILICGRFFGRKFQDFLNVKVLNLQPIFWLQNSRFATDFSLANSSFFHSHLRLIFYLQTSIFFLIHVCD